MVEKVKEEKTHHQNRPTDAYCCWHVGDEGGRPNVSLWAEFRLIALCDGQYLVDKNYWLTWKNNGKKVKNAKTHCHLPPAAASWCLDGSSVGGGQNFSLWTSLWLIPWCESMLSIGFWLKMSVLQKVAAAAKHTRGMRCAFCRWFFGTPHTHKSIQEAGLKTSRNPPIYYEDYFC